MKILLFSMEVVTLFVAICLISDWMRLNGVHQISLSALLDSDFLVGLSCLVSFLLVKNIRKNIYND